MDSPRCEMNFLADLARMCDAWLVADGVALSVDGLGEPMGLPEMNVLYRYFNLRRRRPPSVPRRILRSRELRCPPELRAGFEQLEREISTGRDLFPRLSRRLAKPQQSNNLAKNDHLLADWDVQHLHLGLDTDRLPSGQIRGTEMVLFCILDAHDAYLIQILDHGAFSEPELLDIVRANWPHLLTSLPLAPGLPITREKVTLARSSGVNLLASFADGSAVGQRGGGITTSGHSIHELRLATEWARVADRWEGCVRDALPSLLAESRERNVSIPDLLHVQLYFDDANGGWSAIYLEIESRQPLPGPPEGLEPLR